MPFNGQGQFTPKHIWVNEANSGIPILPANFDDQAADIAAGLSNTILRDGTGGPTADVPWNNFGITGLRAPQLGGDAVNKSYVDTATADRSMGGYKLINLANPVNPQDAATMGWVGGNTTALPTQTGKVGQFLSTNGTIASWAFAQTVVRSPRTANAMLAAADRGSLIDITSGTFAQTFDTAANLGAGWYCYIRNSGAGSVTIPSSDGASNWIMYPGEVRLFQCDGTGFYSIVLVAFTATFAASGNFIRPPGYAAFDAELWGAGAGGCGAGTSSPANGGAGGGYFRRLFFAADFGAVASSTPVTIGAGGVGGASSSTVSVNTGGAGGTTSLLGISATGGVSVAGSPTAANGGSGCGIVADPFLGAMCNANASASPAVAGNGKPIAGSSGAGGGTGGSNLPGGTGGMRLGSPGTAATTNPSGTPAAAPAFGGGAGGTAVTSGQGYNGGAGGIASGGGGGGIGSTAGGTGGNGGPGYAVIRGVF